MAIGTLSATLVSQNFRFSLHHQTDTLIEVILYIFLFSKGSYRLFWLMHGCHSLNNRRIIELIFFLINYNLGCASQSRNLTFGLRRVFHCFNNSPDRVFGFSTAKCVRFQITDWPGKVELVLQLSFYDLVRRLRIDVGRSLFWCCWRILSLRLRCLFLLFLISNSTSGRPLALEFLSESLLLGLQFLLGKFWCLL